MSGGDEGRRWRLRPGIVLPLLLSAALLAFAFSISSLPRVLDRIAEVSPETVALGFVLALAYLAVKYVAFNLLLVRLGIRPGRRRVVFAFVVAEMTIAIPAGLYVQNYILERMRSAGFARSAAATTAILLVELAVALAVLALLGVPSWSWVRPAALAVLAGLVLFLRLFLATDFVPARLVPWLRRTSSKAIPRALADLTAGLRELAEPRTLVPLVLLAALYLGVLAAAFMVVGRATGARGLDYSEAVAVYAFSLAVTLMLAGVLTQLGVIEVAGLGAAAAFGHDASSALAMMVGFRLVWMGSIWLACGPTALSLRGVLRGAHGRGAEPSRDPKTGGPS